MYFPDSYLQMGFDNLRISYFSLDAPPVHRGTISFGIGLIILEFQDSDVFLLQAFPREILQTLLQLFESWGAETGLLPMRLAM